MPRRRRELSAAQQRALISALQGAACYDHEVGAIRLVETHISWVLLTGRYAYKIKKALRLPFLDFSTLAQRRRFCTEELRLNRRLAPALYLAVVPIGGPRASPHVGRRPALEYAVKMRQFDTDDELDRLVARDALPRTAVVEFAARLAQFHGQLPAVHTRAPGAAVLAAARDNLAALEQYGKRREARVHTALRNWTELEGEQLGDVFERRARAGAYRECHGDLHLKNLLCHDGAVMAFDALEFDRALREIDVVSEVAFLAMDLLAAARADLAYAFVNAYFEASGDYDGVHVLRFYLVHRALVRAKVQAIAAAQHGRTARDDKYIRTALELATPVRPLLLITHGLSGSGKTHVTTELVSRLPALRVRSDLERKRLHGFAARARTGAGVGSGIYAAAAGKRTYAALAAAAERLLAHGFNAIVDAAFLRRADRLAFRQLAASTGARFAILDCAAPAAELRRRIEQRNAAGRDASEASLAVLDQQLREQEPLDRTERHAAVHVATHRRLRYANLLKALGKI